MGRKKKLPLLENVTITDFAAEGKAVTRINDMVLFAPYLAPGDVADIKVTKKRKKYMEGFYTEIHELSDERTEPVCAHFGVCGGCKWQHLKYDRQVFYKEKQVADTLKKFSKIDLPEVQPIIGSKEQTRYRNKNEYTFSANRWLTDNEIKSEHSYDSRNALGFHVPGRYDRVLDITDCHLQSELANKIRNQVRQFTLDNGYAYYNQNTNEGFMRNIIIRNTNIGEFMVLIVFGANDMERINALMEHVKNQFPEITSLQYVVSKKLNTTINDLDIICYYGRDHIFEKLDDVVFKIGPKSFFQTNTAQAEQLYRKTKAFAQLDKNHVVYDLYTGTGTIANYIAKDCKKVIGIEYVPEAIADANINAELNKNTNTLFFAGDMKDVFNQEFIAGHGAPDVVITDPPRAGMHPDVVNAILNARPQRIVYISCNPSTQARDLEVLGRQYNVEQIQPVDMFPHTHHVENIVSLKIKH